MLFAAVDCHCEFVILLFMITNVTSYEITILNTATATSNLKGWLVKTYVDEIETNSFATEWEELSFNYQNITERGFQICPKQNSSSQSKARSWLRTPMLEATGAARVYVELKFWMRECSDLKDTMCRETFKLFSRLMDSSFIDSTALNPHYYHSVDTVAAESRFYPGRETGSINTETVSISLVRGERNSFARDSSFFPKFYVAVVDEGACIALTSVRIFYKVCQETVNHLARFPQTIAGPSDTSLIAVYGKCVAYSSLSLTHFTTNQSAPLFHCTSSGEWNIRTGTCVCDAGFEPDDFHVTCMKCSLNMFKSSAGNEKCSSCPGNSFTKIRGATYCECDFQSHNYYHMSSERDCDLCAELPSPPINVNITVDEHSSNAADLTWSSPHDNGNCKSITYCVLCQSFSQQKDTSDDVIGNSEFGNLSALSINDLSCGGLVFKPHQCGIPYPFTAIHNLEARTSYRFVIVASNAVSEKYYSSFHLFLNEMKKAQTNSTTTSDLSVLDNQMRTLISTSGVAVIYKVEALLPSRVSNVRLIKKNLTSATISWFLPHYTDDNSLFFELHWHEVNNGEGVSSRSNSGTADFNPWVQTTADFSIVLIELRSEVSYEVVVRAKNTAGYGNFSDPIYFHLSSGSLKPSTKAAESGNAMRTYVTLAGVLVVIVMVLILMVLLWSKSRNKPSVVAQAEDNAVSDQFNDDDPQLDFDDSISVAQRTYVDPFFLRAAQSNFECETKPEFVTTSRVIGCGEFGEVYQGILVKKGTSGDDQDDERIDVAVKQLRAQCQPPEQVSSVYLDFLREANALATFQHPNIVKLEAVVTTSRPFMIVTELMKNGCLAAFLQRHRVAGRAFPPIVLVRMLKGVAQGMEYLTHLNYIHRDLAARNVLINEDLVCKVADFGLTRRVDAGDCTDSGSQTYTTHGGKIAIRWTAPEAVAYNCYSQASDVWSFGVFAWEVMTYAEKPYWSLTNQQVLQAVNDGFRLPAPEDCPAVLHQLMLDCWHGERLTRPTFTQLTTKFCEIEEHPEKLETLASAASTGIEEMMLTDPNDAAKPQVSSHLLSASNSHESFCTPQSETNSSLLVNQGASFSNDSGVVGNCLTAERSQTSDLESSRESLAACSNSVEICDETTAMLDDSAVTLVMNEMENNSVKYKSHS